MVILKLPLWENDNDIQWSWKSRHALSLNFTKTAAQFSSGQYGHFLYGKEGQKERKLWYLWSNEGCDPGGYLLLFNSYTESPNSKAILDG